VSALRAALEEAVWRRLISFDEAVLLRVRRWESAFATRVMKSLTRLGDPESWVLAGLGLGLSGPQGLRLCRLLGTGALLALVLSQVLKRICCRKRPSCGIRGFSALADNPDAFSFPSGHTAVAFAVAMALSGEGVGLGPFLLVLACGIALSRIYLGAHYPLDVAVGVLVGSLAGLAARLLAAGSAAPLLLSYALLGLLPGAPPAV
jgi:undecaprenyl-diphosphatase